MPGQRQRMPIDLEVVDGDYDVVLFEAVLVRPATTVDLAEESALIGSSLTASQCRYNGGGSLTLLIITVLFFSLMRKPHGGPPFRMRSKMLRLGETFSSI